MCEDNDWDSYCDDILKAEDIYDIADTWAQRNFGHDFARFIRRIQSGEFRNRCTCCWPSVGDPLAGVAIWTDLLGKDDPYNINEVLNKVNREKG